MPAQCLLIAFLMASCTAPEAEPAIEGGTPEPVETIAAMGGQEATPTGEEMDDPDPIQVKFDACQESENYTTIGMHKCIGEALEDWDAELNRVYAAIMDTADEELAAVIRTSQRNWIEYRDADLEVILAIHSRTQGTYWGVEMGMRRLQTLENQVMRLRWYLLMQS